MAKNGSGYNAPRTFCDGGEKQSSPPRFCYRPLRPELKQEKQLLERLSHRHWKAISMRVGIGLGDTYGPMHYPGMRSLWQSPANFHQHLAFPTPLLSFTRPSYLVPLFSLSFLPPPPSPKPCPPVIVPGRWPLIEREGETREGERDVNCPVRASVAQSRRCAITLVLFPITAEPIVDTSRGEKSVSDSTPLV